MANKIFKSKFNPKLDCSRTVNAKCEDITWATSNASWLQNDLTPDLPTVSTVIEKLKDHLESQCRCSARSGIYLLLASSYLEQFTILFWSAVENMSKLSVAESPNKRESKNKIINDIDVQEQSRYVLLDASKLTDCNFNHLIQPAISSLECYKQIDLKQLSSAQIEKYNILTKLQTLFEVFMNYNLYRHALRASHLALHVLRRFYPKRMSFTNDDHLLVVCNTLRVHLRLGCYRRAKLLYRQFMSEITKGMWKHVPAALLIQDSTSSAFPVFNTSKINTIGHALFFLIQVELGLLSRNLDLISTELKNFLNGEYLAGNTVKRYLLRAMASATASKFPSSRFDYRKTLNELSEPFQMLMVLGKRWGMFPFSNSTKVQRCNDTDVPLKFRLMVLGAMADVTQGHLDFMVGTGLLTEASYFCKMAQSLHISTLNIIGLARVQLSSIEYDLKMELFKDAAVKMDAVKALFHQHSTREHKSIFKPFSARLSDTKSANGNELLPEKNVIDSDRMIAPAFENPPEDNYALQEEKNLTAREAYRLLLAINRPKRNKVKEDFDLPVPVLVGQNLLKSFAENFTSLRLPPELFPHLYALYLHISVIEIRIAYQKNKAMFTPDLAFSHYRSMLCCLEEYITRIYSSMFQKELKEIEEEMGPIQKDDDNLIMMQNFIVGPFSTLHWTISDFFLKVLIDIKSYQKAHSILDHVTQVSSFTVSSRMIRATMFYYKALCLYKLGKAQFKKELENPFKVFKVTNTKLEGVLPPVTLASSVTPTNSSRVKSKALKAPVKAANYVDKDLHLYASSLLTVADESKREGSRNVLHFDDIDMKTPIKSWRRKTALKAITPNTTAKSTKKKRAAAGDIGDDLVKAFSGLKLEQHTEETYCSKWFEQSPLEIKEITLEQVKDTLKKVVAYICHHPSIELYTLLQRLLYKVAKNEAIKKRLGYYFVDTSPDLALRYRYLLNHQRRLDRKLINETGGVYDLDLVRITSTDYHYQSYLDELEPNWRYLQVRTIPNGSDVPDMLLCRYQKNKKPLFLRIKPDPDKDFAFFMSEFAEVMSVNMSSIRETEKEIFWKVRTEWNAKLNKLLEVVERKWFGCLKGFFLGQIVDAKYQEAMKKALQYLKVKELIPTDWSLMELFLESLPFLTEGEIEAGVKLLYTDPSVKNQILKIRQHYFQSVEPMESLMKKAVQPVALILDPILAQFPFESMPTFRQYGQPFFRVPSIRFAVVLCKAHRELLSKGVDCCDAFYLLNPSDNLPATQERFGEALKSIPGWRGVMQDHPNEKQLLDMISSAFYLYCGHGSGSSSYKGLPHSFDMYTIKPVSFVFGCSSGRLVYEGPNTEAFGSAYRFLIAGSPTYIGNLWDVTDKDIDQYADALLTFATTPIWKACLEPNTKTKLTECAQDFARAVAQARQSCKLSHLIGAAPVIYGLPLQSLNRETL